MTSTMNFHLTLYRTPTNRVRLEKWNDALTSSEEVITNSAYICINHFNKNDLVGRGIKKKTLKQY